MTDGRGVPRATGSPTVLIVEDDARIADFMTKALRAHSFSVEWVTTGEEAIARTASGGIDVQVLDLGLPDIDGLAVLRELHQRGVSVPVVVVTARSDPRDRAAARVLGVEHYLTKPFPLKDFLAAVRATCGMAVE